MNREKVTSWRSSRSIASTSAVVAAVVVAGCGTTSTITRTETVSAKAVTRTVTRTVATMSSHTTSVTVASPTTVHPASTTAPTTTLKPPPAATPAEIAAHGKYSEWKDASAAAQLAIAAAWFDAHATVAERAWIGPADVAAQVAGEHAGDVNAGLGGTLQSYLTDGADRALNTRAAAVLKQSFHGGGLVGNSMTSCRELLGAPKSQQVIAGQTIWYYDAGDWTSQTGDIQVVFDGQTVAQVNLYG